MKLHRVIQFSWIVNGGVDQITLDPLPRRSVGGGTTVRRLDTKTEEALGGVQVQRKWIFR